MPLLTGRPLVCVASHTHFDHIGSHHEFSDRCVHCAEADILADPRNEWTAADRYATDEMFDAFPPDWRADAYRVLPAPADRLLNEYGLQTGFDPAPCDTVRWIQSDDPAALARFVEKNRSSVATDLDGAQVYLASSAFNLTWTAERNPDIKFVDIKTTTV